MILSVKGGVIQERDDSTRGMTPRDDSGKLVESPVDKDISERIG